MGRRVRRQEGAVVRERRRALGLDLLDCRRERHLAEAVVVAIGLAIRRAVDELGPRARLGEGRVEPRHEVLGALEQPVERDRAREVPVVEEDRQREPTRPAPEIGAARVDPVRLLPGRGAERAHAERLVRRQDRELHAGLGQHLERFVVHRGLRQPEALGLTPEPRAEVVDPPAHLRDLVATRGERHDHVVVDLRARVPVAVARRDARPIGRDDLRVHLRPVTLEPDEESRADVERDLLEVVDDVEDPVVLVDAPRGGVGRVALRGHPLVPVVVRRRRVLDFHRLEPGILARRLIEMAVDDDRAVHNSSRFFKNSRRPPRGTTTSPEASTW